ncbi:pentatricopeptide repeat-containing protein 2, mitochondrial-like [Culicoides brevitarsis]|uniref:pentatricopeptide repeat-containing protein 2, mitochondrial-like n=1 Tax=Culicoides brevitarsis TaxID=469753 RepID=UPI00307C1598
MLRNIIKSVQLQRFNGKFANLSLNSVRTLYSAEALGINSYEAGRSRTQSSFVSSADRFKEKMSEFCSDDSKNMVFSDDLKNMVHLAEKQDIPLVVKMLQKFVSQNSNLRFGNYVFGPVIMRMFYFFDDPDTALQVFRDPNCEGLFNQWSSYQILCDLLYKKGRYQDVLDVYDIVKKNTVDASFPKHTIILVLGSCYKLNTPESYKYALELMRDMNSKGHIPMRRSVTFAAGLALAQNEPQVALEMLLGTKQQNYITVRNMKVVAMLDLGRVEDVIPILRSILEAPVGASMHKQTFCIDVLDRVRKEMEKVNDKELKLDYERIDRYLREHEHVSQKSIDELLCAEIEVQRNPPNEYNRNKTFINASFQRDSRDRYNKRPYQQHSRQAQRPGLNEMY